MSKIIIIAHSRLHMSLIDLNGSLGRIDGGFGVALEKPFIKVELEETDEPFKKDYTDEILIESLRKAKKYFNYTKNVNIRILNDYPAHMGLGHTTQFMLSIGKAISIFKNVNLKNNELAKLLGRGGTSGIGVNVFEKGGFIVDAGHSYGIDKEKKSFLPSRFSNATPPPIIGRYDFPEEWNILLLLPNIADKIFGEKELNVFNEFCPISSCDVEKLSRILLMQIIPSILEKDFNTFGEALKSVRNIGFKKIEIQLQHQFVKDIINILELNKINAFGISSMGPCIFILYKNKYELSSILSEITDLEIKYSIKCDKIYTRGYNYGASKEIVQ